MVDLSTNSQNLILQAKELYNTAGVSLDEAKGLELQARCCAERLELASWIME